MPLFDPMECLTLGERLAEGSTEAELRTAINRAYYACHLMARDRMFGDDHAALTRTVRKSLGGDKHASEHEIVSNAIKQNTGMRAGFAKRLSDELGELRSMRHQADYYRNSDREQIKGQLFQHYRVSGWSGLARTAMVKARSLVPDIGSLQAYRRRQ